MEIKVIVEEDKYSYKLNSLRDHIYNFIWLMYDRSWMNLQESLTYSLINGVIEPISLIFFPNKIPLVNSAGFSYKGYGVLISGVGGVGNTTTSLNLLYRYRDILYMNDDMAIIDKDGNLLFYPRKMMIYYYNMVDVPSLRSTLKENQKILDKIHWILHLSKKRERMSRRRISPIRLLGENKINFDPVPLKIIFFLDKGEKELIEDISTNEFSRIMAEIMIDREYKQFGDKLFRILPYMNKSEWIEKYTTALTTRLNNKTTKVVRIKMTSNTNYSKVEKNIISYLKFLRY